MVFFKWECCKDDAVIHQVSYTQKAGKPMKLEKKMQSPKEVVQQSPSVKTMNTAVLDTTDTTHDDDNSWAEIDTEVFDINYVSPMETYFGPTLLDAKLKRRNTSAVLYPKELVLLYVTNFDEQSKRTLCSLAQAMPYCKQDVQVVVQLLLSNHQAFEKAVQSMPKEFKVVPRFIASGSFPNETTMVFSAHTGKIVCQNVEITLKKLNRLDTHYSANVKELVEQWKLQSGFTQEELDQQRMERKIQRQRRHEERAARGSTKPSPTKAQVADVRLYR